MASSPTPPHVTYGQKLLRELLQKSPDPAKLDELSAKLGRVASLGNANGMLSADDHRNLCVISKVAQLVTADMQVSLMTYCMAVDRREARKSAELRRMEAIGNLALASADDAQDCKSFLGLQDTAARSDSYFRLFIRAGIVTCDQCDQIRKEMRIAG